MTLQKLAPHSTRPADVHNQADEPESGASGLLEQASAYGRVAREAHENCEKGKDAEKALLARRNRSGQ